MPLARRGAWLVLAAMASLPAAAQWKDWDYEFDQEKKPWQEMQAQLPTYPKTDNLRKVDGGGGSSHQFFIDDTSVSVGDDGVVRYTLMVKTGGGATNVSFEGIRCESRDYKVYAFGRTNGEWSRARDPQWRHIEAQTINGYRYILHNEYFCPAKKFPASLKEIAQNLRYGPPRRPE